MAINDGNDVGSFYVFLISVHYMADIKGSRFF